MPSEIIGTGALWLGLIAAILMAVTQRPGIERLRSIARPALVAVAIQVLHFTEEYLTQFYRLFPQRLGLTPWSAEFFLAFNLAWLAAWLLGIGAAVIGRASLYAAIVLWFLAIAAIGNGIAHPLLAIGAGGYFPGLITAPFLGIAGLFLARRLLSKPVEPSRA